MNVHYAHSEHICTGDDQQLNSAKKIINVNVLEGILWGMCRVQALMPSVKAATDVSNSSSNNSSSSKNSISIGEVLPGQTEISFDLRKTFIHKIIHQ